MQWNATLVCYWNNCIWGYTWWQTFMALLNNRIQIFHALLFTVPALTVKLYTIRWLSFLDQRHLKPRPHARAFAHPSCCLNKLTLSVSRSVNEEIKAKRKLITLENRLVFKGWGPSGTLLVECSVPGHHSSATPNKHLQNVQVVVDRDAVVAFRWEAFFCLYLGTYQENGIGSLGK